MYVMFDVYPTPYYYADLISLTNLCFQNGYPFSVDTINTSYNEVNCLGNICIYF